MDRLAAGSSQWANAAHHVSWAAVSLERTEVVISMAERLVWGIHD
jgi:hypothetical protein